MSFVHEYESIQTGIDSGDEIFVFNRRPYQITQGVATIYSQDTVYVDLQGSVKFIRGEGAISYNDTIDPRDGDIYVISEDVQLLDGTSIGFRVEFINISKSPHYIRTSSKTHKINSGNHLLFYWTGSSWVTYSSDDAMYFRRVLFFLILLLIIFALYYVLLK